MENRGVYTVIKIISMAVIVALMFIVANIKVSAGTYVDDLILRYDGQVYKYDARLVTIEIDGVELQTKEMPAVLINDTTMVPIREVLEHEHIGATVSWVAETQQVHITYLDKYIVLTLDSKTAMVNNEEMTMNVAPKLVYDLSQDSAKTMIPIRFVVEAIGLDVGWDPDTYTAIISTLEAAQDTEEPLSTEGNTDDAAADDDTTTDNSIVSGEQLDSLTGTKANRSLPTALAGSPVIFSVGSDVNIEEEISASYSEIDITPEDNEFIYIDDIDYIEDNGEFGFLISATGPISDVSTSVWDGKFIVEIYNSNLDLFRSTIEYDDNPVVTAIRTGNQEGGSSKVVFDLKASGYKFNLVLADDRESIMVEAVNNSIYHMELSQNSAGDYIDITGVNAAVIEAFRLSNPTRIVFDMPNTQTLLGYQSSDAEGQYVTAIRTAQFDSTTSRIVVETDGHPDYQVIAVSDNVTRIQFLEPTYENVSYDNTEETPTIIIEKEDDSDLSVDNITYVDNYLDHEFIITLPGDYTDYFGSDQVNINDAVIDNISFKLNKSGDTEVTIKSKTIHEFRIEETDDGLNIKAYKPTELYSKVIVIDAGHGGDDPGAVVGSWYEKYTTLGTILELKELLDREEDMKVYYTRLVDTRPSLFDRANLANEVDADFFLSVHINSINLSYLTGTETLYLPGPNTSGLNSFELADIFLETFTDNTALEPYLAKQRDNLYVTNATEMPAIILEMGYLTNAYDYKYLTDENYYDDLAEGIYLSIQETFSQHPTGR